ncbi:RagB/SusD family nutrient uptake outer membrane protein [Hymenobacter sp. GOD-10R]|uniref:RagB/SusD family nutrient uptake outer membrane protein n=1 Tax=Hymenobacter sp. GOD-10R TaxID=3093922 RepID=UPI002D79EA0A|nr:RagB/SusD family nutrient uptake outer membrane protein [Hymenobacter sp. GOD-10R]WRQ29089.1 RagB/SusD family nutrient uptake outer membrane protein [Hymenobacter sp. GOD-10R]
MKSFKAFTYTALLSLSSLALFSCEDSLNISPEAHNSIDDFYKTEVDVNQGVMAIYSNLLTLPTNSHWNMSEMRADNVVVNISLSVQRDYADINGYLATSQTGQFQSTWTNLYQLVYRANTVLDRITPFNFTRVPQFQGEARFLRALAYFDLVRYWGDVPIVSKPVTISEAKGTPRSPIADVYAFIVDDLKFAADNLPDTYAAADKGRATKWAAKALLGRVYLTMYGYPLKQADKLVLAKQQLGDVVAAEGRTTAVPTIAADYTNIFKTAYDNLYNIFEVQYISGTGGLGSQIPSDQAFQFPSQWSAYQPFGPDATINPNLFGAGWPKPDVRKFASLDSGYVDTKTNAKSGRTQFTKFLEKGTTAPTGQRDYPNNFPIIRVEDVLLMYAEVLNEESGGAVPAQALAILNRIRTRAKVPALSSMSKDEFRLALEQERRWEFAAEGLRWHDLVRTGRAIPVMNQFVKDNGVKLTRPIDEHDLLYPIPLQELQINPGFWQQNPGY